MGFEVVVRPVVLPNIRPAPAQSLPPLDDPEQGFAEIRGNGGKQIDLTNSFSSSTSSSQKKETKRRVDEVRVYQKNDDGTVNRDNFLDVQVANKVWMKGGRQSSPGFWLPLEAGGGGGSSTTTTGTETWDFTPVTEDDNIAVIEHNKMVYPSE